MRWLGVVLTGLAVLRGGAVLGQHPSLQTGKAAPATTSPAAPVQPGSPEQQGAATTLTAQAKLVNLPVVVRDGKGVLAPGLTKPDFTLLVDGKPQEVRYFDVDANLPLTLGLLVDTSQSQRGALDEERTASQAFLDQMLTRAKDQAFVLQFTREVELLQDVTGSKPKLQAALKELATPAPSSSGRDTGVVDPDDASDREARREKARGGTAFYDAVFLASDEIMRKQTGRKALLLLTDGNDRSSKETLATAIETAQRGDTVVYAIYFKGETPRQDRSLDDRDRYPGNGGGYPGGRYPGGGYPGGGYPGGGRRREPEQLPNARNDGKKILDRMTRETGGRMFEATKKQPLTEIYAEIGRELRAQYRLGFTPEAGAAEDEYHKVEVGLNGDRKKWLVQTREGYYAGK